MEKNERNENDLVLHTHLVEPKPLGVADSGTARGRHLRVCASWRILHHPGCISRNDPIDCNDPRLDRGNNGSYGFGAATLLVASQWPSLLPKCIRVFELQPVRPD